MLPVSIMPHSWIGIMFPFEELVLVLTDGFAKKNIDIIRIYPRRVCFSPSAWSLSHVQLFAIQWTLAHQARLSVGFSRQENWGGLPWPSCPRGWTCVSYVSCTGSRVLYQLHHLGSPLLVIPAYEFSLGSLDIRCLEVSCFCLVPPLLHSTTDIIRKPDWAHVKFQAPCLCLPALLYLAIPPMSKQDCLPQGKDHFGLKFFKGFFF